MMKNLFLKTLYDKKMFIIGWSLGFIVLSYLMTIFYPTFQNNALEELSKNMPPALQGLIGDLGLLKNINTYISLELFEVRIPIIVSIMAIILGMNLSVGEEEKGYTKLLSTLPISRNSIVLQKYCAMILICAFIALSITIGIWLGAWQINTFPDSAPILRLVTMTWLLMVALASLVYGIGVLSGKRGVTMFFGTLLAIGSFILTTFSKGVEWLQEYEVISILHYIQPTQVVQEGFSWRNIMILVIISAIFIVLSLLAFRNRDIRG